MIKMIKNCRYNSDGSIGISLDETSEPKDVNDLLKVFKSVLTVEEIVESGLTEGQDLGSSSFKRSTPYLEHPVFNMHHSETRIVRYMKALENKDVSLVHSMIPLVNKRVGYSLTKKMNYRVQ